ncbi:hypothetical protein ACFL09_02925 [Planctomycetota bacterium]
MSGTGNRLNVRLLVLLGSVLLAPRSSAASEGPQVTLTIKESAEGPTVGTWTNGSGTADCHLKVGHTYTLEGSCSCEHNVTVDGEASPVQKSYTQSSQEKDKSATATCTQCDVQSTGTFTVLAVTDVQVTAGPAYSGPYPKCVGDGSIEIEKPDSVTVRAIMTPLEDGSLVTWGGDEVTGTGLQKQITYTQTGDKWATATCGTSSGSARIYVNHNALSPINNMSVQAVGREWAHVGDESVTLRADAVDRDWKYGFEDTMNDEISLPATEWHVNTGTLDQQTGETVEWTPTEPGGATATATFHDAQDSTYSPRNDDDRDPATARQMQGTPGGFKVFVALTGPGGYSATLDEDGNTTGGTIPAQFTWGGGAQLFADTSGTKPMPDLVDPDPYNGDVTVTWTYKALPDDADIGTGTIRATLSASLEGTMEVRCWDDDLWDGTTTINLGFYGLPGGFGFAFGPVIELGDSSESASGVSWGFDSDDLGKSNPDGNALTATSSPDDPYWPAIPWMTPSTYEDVSHQKSDVVAKASVNAESRARYDLFAKAKAYQNSRAAPYSFAIVGIDCTATLGLSGVEFSR